MYWSKLIVVFLLFVASIGVRCENGEDDYEDFYKSSCDIANQVELADAKSEITLLQEKLVHLRQKLDPDFKLSPQSLFHFSYSKA